MLSIILMDLDNSYNDANIIAILPNATVSSMGLLYVVRPARLRLSCICVYQALAIKLIPPHCGHGPPGGFTRCHCKRELAAKLDFFSDVSVSDVFQRNE